MCINVVEKHFLEKKVLVKILDLDTIIMFQISMTKNIWQTTFSTRFMSYFGALDPKTKLNT